jgi:hypothetical protein
VQNAEASPTQWALLVLGCAASGVTVLVAGTFKTDILELTQTYADPDGPYAAHHAGLIRTGRWILRVARPPERFAPGLERALTDRAPFARHAVGLDARIMLLGSRLLPTRLFQRVVGLAIRLPQPGTLRTDPVRLATVAPRVEERDALR